MKKMIMLVIAMLMLAACGGTTEEQPDSGDIYSHELEEEYDENEFDESMTDEAEEIMSSDSKFSTFLASEDEYDTFVFDIKERYTSDKTDANGITETDIMRRDQVDDENETFDYKFSLMLAENQENEQNYLLFVGDVVNNTSKRVQFNHDFDVIMRDIKLEDSTYGGMYEGEGLVDAYEPEFEDQGWYAFPIDSEEIPKQLELKFERAWDSDGDGGSGEAEEYLDINFEME